MNTTAATPVRIRPASDWKALDLRLLWRYRELLGTLGRRDLTLRYRQTLLGVFWVVAQPLMAAGIFAFVFGGVAKLPSDGIPYFLFSYAGLLGWNLFSGTLTKVSVSLVGNAHLISKVYFPRLILPLSTLYSTLVDFAVALAMMFGLMASRQLPPGPGLLLLPLCAACLLALALGAGLIAASLTVHYRDIAYILPVAVQMLLYASPVAYAASAIPEPLRWVCWINPLSPLLEGFRWSLLGTGTLSAPALLYAVAFSATVLAAGVFAFKGLERLFADVI